MLGFRARSASFKLIRVYNYHVITRSRVPEGVIIKKLVKADVVSYQVPFFRSHVFYLQIFSRVCPWFAPDVYCWSRSREFSIRYSMTESFWRLPKLSRQFMNLFAWGCKYFVIRCCVVSVLCWIWKKKRGKKDNKNKILISQSDAKAKRNIDAVLLFCILVLF